LNQGSRVFIFARYQTELCWQSKELMSKQYNKLEKRRRRTRYLKRRKERPAQKAPAAKPAPAA
jgi:hypothetical protein